MTIFLKEYVCMEFVLVKKNFFSSVTEFMFVECFFLGEIQ
jgi:hypothetical protein